MSTIRIGGQTTSWLSVGWIIALLVLVIAIVLMIIGRLDYIVGGLIAGAALSRLT